MTLQQTGDLTLLGSAAPATITADQIETFPAPDGCAEVRITGAELVSKCPLTGQTDIYEFEIVYQPGARCLESKALKLYLASYRDAAGVFAEGLAVRIRDDLAAALSTNEADPPRRLSVRLTQNPRGGMQITATSVYHAPRSLL
jgi:7-cyano-7-deazaguanine reductase